MIRFFLFMILLSSLLFAQDGLIKTFHDNGKVKSEINYSHGVREGEAKFYSEEGILIEERNYVNGRVEGLVREFTEDGKPEEVYNIENGKREGPTSLYDSNGVYLTDIYYENGIRVVESDDYEENPQQEVAEEVKKEDNTSRKITSSKNSFPLPAELEKEQYEADPAFYLTAEVMPEPVGGLDALEDRVFYPSYAKKNKIEGIVKILTFIDRSGNVVKTEIIEGIGYGCDESAETVVRYSKFKPGLLKGKPVNVQMVIPIEFKLDE